jgi:hypothetical protein
MPDAHPTGCAKTNFLELMKAAGPGFVCGFGKMVTVGLQNAFEIFQETHGPFAPAPHAELEDGCSARGSVLPQIAGVVPRPAIACLHIHRRLIGLDVSAAD